MIRESKWDTSGLTTIGFRYTLSGDERRKNYVDKLAERLVPLEQERDALVQTIEEEEGGACGNRLEEIGKINTISANGAIENATLLRVYVEGVVLDRDYEAGERVSLGDMGKVYLDGASYPVNSTWEFSMVLDEAMKAGDRLDDQIQHVPGAHPRLVSLQKLSDVIDESRYNMQMGAIDAAVSGAGMFIPGASAGASAATKLAVFGASQVVEGVAAGAIYAGADQALGTGGERVPGWTHTGVKGATDGLTYDRARKAILGGEDGVTVCGTKLWNAYDCSPFDAAIARYNDDLQRELGGDYTVATTEYGAGRTGVTGQCVSTRFPEGEADWMCKIAEQQTCTGNWITGKECEDQRTCRQKVNELVGQGFGREQAKAMIQADYEPCQSIMPPPEPGLPGGTTHVTQPVKGSGGATLTQQAAPKGEPKKQQQQQQQEEELPVAGIVGLAAATVGIVWYLSSSKR